MFLDGVYEVLRFVQSACQYVNGSCLIDGYASAEDKFEVKTGDLHWIGDIVAVRRYVGSFVLPPGYTGILEVEAYGSSVGESTTTVSQPFTRGELSS